MRRSSPGTGGRGVTRARRLVGELAAAGYLERRRRQLGNGRWTTDVVLYMEPQPPPVPLALVPPVDKPGKAAGRTEPGKPGIGKPGIG
jgi:hypothetical protein